MKQFKFPVRDSCLNPFLINPVQAVQSDPSHFGRLKEFNISHAFTCNEGIICCGEWHGSKGYTQVNLKDIRIANHHEALRFEMLLEMLGISI